MKLIFLGVISLFFCSLSFADSWAYPRKDLVVESGNGEYRFTAIFPRRDLIVSSGRSKLSKKGKSEFTESCIGVLEKVSGMRKAKKMWRKELVNKVTPLDVIVTDDGQRVVTFDNWFGVGKDPIVIYNEKGELLRRHDLESLDLIRFTEGRMVKTDTGYAFVEGYISESVSSTHWRRDALTFLSEDQKILFVRLYWGHILAVDLLNGEVLSPKQYGAENDYVELYVFQAVKELLDSTDGYDRKRGAAIVASTRALEFEERLVELLSDPEYSEMHIGGKGPYKNYYVRKAAYDALEEMGRDPGEIVTKELFSKEEFQAYKKKLSSQK